MKLLRDNTNVFNSIIDHISILFDVDVRQVRLNRYESNEPKPAHQDAPAVMGSRAELDQNITIALTLGGTPRAVEFSPLLNEGAKISLPVSSGDIYAFTQAVNLSFTHAVEKSKEDDTSPRYSIIVWGKVRVKIILPENTMRYLFLENYTRFTPLARPIQLNNCPIQFLKSKIFSTPIRNCLLRLELVFLVPRELEDDMSGINFSRNHIFQILFIKT